MMLEYVIGGLSGLLALGYLVYALLYPEEF